MHPDPSAYCEMVALHPDISNATARFGAWLIGAAAMSGGFPVELTNSQIRFGFERNGVHVPGLGGRNETINASINWLEENKYLAVAEGRRVNWGYTARNFTLTL